MKDNKIEFEYKDKDYSIETIEPTKHVYKQVIVSMEKNDYLKSLEIAYEQCVNKESLDDTPINRKTEALVGQKLMEKYFTVFPTVEINDTYPKDGKYITDWNRYTREHGKGNVFAIKVKDYEFFIKGVQSRKDYRILFNLLVQSRFLAYEKLIEDFMLGGDNVYEDDVAYIASSTITSFILDYEYDTLKKN